VASPVLNGEREETDKNRALRLPNGNVKIFGTSCGMVSPPTERSEGPETRGGLVTHGTLSRLLLKCAGGREHRGAHRHVEGVP